MEPLSKRPRCGLPQQSLDPNMAHADQFVMSCGGGATHSLPFACNPPASAVSSHHSGPCFRPSRDGGWPTNQSRAEPMFCFWQRCFRDSAVNDSSSPDDSSHFGGADSANGGSLFVFESSCSNFQNV
eukprot:gnl/Spiro4/29673_TR14560_c0_g1_i1.p1 gnl/Spiro4/29673_TR14560_c0_g1~~gnl/Spiro4/29673_TR14560_c0_g1_i1.p1  ORF type:complete len:127 (+),score=19.49 gnl/Spiro4/29673_TR14560_c0_g1_i1:110-490(+)